MKISKTFVSLSVEEAFDYLYHKDQRVWREAVDLIADYAEECFQKQFLDTPDLNPPFEDGIHFSGSEDAIFFTTAD
jgi:hypothetical protein